MQFEWVHVQLSVSKTGKGMQSAGASRSQDLSTTRFFSGLEYGKCELGMASGLSSDEWYYDTRDHQAFWYLLPHLNKNKHISPYPVSLVN